MRLSKKADAFFDKGNFAALCASVVRLGRTIRRSLRAKCFSDVHATGKTIWFFPPPPGGGTLRGFFDKLMAAPQEQPFCAFCTFLLFRHFFLYRTEKVLYTELRSDDFWPYISSAK